MTGAGRGARTIPAMSTSFTWRDGERVVRFGRGVLGEAPQLLGEGYTLLTTERAQGAGPDVVANAARVIHVPSGRVDEISAHLRATVDSDRLVALGGGRVIDVGKALAAASAGAIHVAAIPTTLSGAEMSASHRHAAGVPAGTPHVRPAIVINDPALSASQPEAALAASAANALAHAIDGGVTIAASPVASLAAAEATRLLTGDLADRDALALGALLAGYVIDANGYGLHHVMAQTLVRFAGLGHGRANAAMLPHTIGALRRRAPAAVDALAGAATTPLEYAARELARRAGATRLRELGVDDEHLATCVAQALQRAELARTPPAADADELRSLYEAAL